ncbi:MAG: deoxyribose-phosphate aldolase [Spirochaetales bacterium]|nr:deoxyribose-phosphate aldolase [Spirochaetales bacterium]
MKENAMNIASYIDHTVLAANATQEKIEKLCQEAAEWKFASVCVNTCWTAFCAGKLRGTGVKVCSVVGFPLGAMATKAKAFEAKCAVEAGAEEVDMVINVGWLKDGKDDLVENDIREVKKACGGKLLKVIIETCLLTDEEKVRACELSEKAGADYVKTSTGFSTGGAKAEDVALMRKTVGDRLGVKASGGIRTYEDAMKMIDAGASRLGCSAGIAIVTSAGKTE